MEKIKYKISKQKKKFLQRMEEFLNTKLYFYGSIQRYDYIDNVSDIDVLIFTNNFDNILLLLNQYLILRNKQIKKIHTISKDNKNTIINGYKINYKSDIIKLEISIYNNKNKKYILQHVRNDFNLPIYFTFCLYILKLINMIIPIPYNKIKGYIMNKLYQKEPETSFFIVN
jgi:predicted nucleotidyltransferase